jgi:DNA-binding transcriptional ArsR family regulator
MIHQDKVAEARKDALDQDEVEELSQLFKAFADPSRLRILYGLSGREMCVCDLAALLEISESAVSHQLRLLRTMKLVTNRREGTILYYRVADEHVAVLISIMREHLHEKQQLPV